MRELGTDTMGRKMVLTDDGKLRLVVPTGQSVTMSRKHLVKTIVNLEAELDKWKNYLFLMDNAEPLAPKGAQE